MLVNMCNQTIRIFAHFKEICFFLCRLYLTTAVRAFSIHKLRFRPERFTRRTIHPLIRAFINVALIIQLLKDLLHLLFMPCIGRTDKIIIRTIHQIPDLFNLIRYAIYIFLWRNACFLCLLFDFLPMLIRSGLEIYFKTFLPFKTRNRICKYNFIRIADMRLAGCIGDRRCDIIFAFAVHI